MGKDSNIQWTNHTFNGWRGCVKVSPACTHCYAEALAKRNPKVLGVWGANGTRVLASESKWQEVLAWDRAAAAAGRPALVFSFSLADVFEDWAGPMTDSQGRALWCCTDGPVTSYLATDGDSRELPGTTPYTLGVARARLWDLIRRTPNLRHQLLTKRPENVPRMMPPGDWPNVWLGTTVESQEYAWRIDALREAPQRVPVRFVSAEPLLGPLQLWDALPGIQWLIVGGESGSAARPFRLGWAESLVAQCRDAGVPCFVKQLGRDPVESQGRRWPLNHDAGHGGDMRDFPATLCVRQFPDMRSTQCA